MIKSAEDEFFENFHLYIRAYFPADLDNNMPKEQQQQQQQQQALMPFNAKEQAQASQVVPSTNSHSINDSRNSKTIEQPLSNKTANDKPNGIPRGFSSLNHGNTNGRSNSNFENTTAVAAISKTECNEAEQNQTDRVEQQSGEEQQLVIQRRLRTYSYDQEDIRAIKKKAQPVQAQSQQQCIKGVSMRSKYARLIDIDTQYAHLLKQTKSLSIKQSNNNINTTNSNQTNKAIAENNSAYNVEQEQVLVDTNKTTFNNNRIVDSTKGNTDKISNVPGKNYNMINNLVVSSNCNSSSSISSRPMSSDSNRSNNNLPYDARNPCSDRLPSSSSGDQAALLNNPYFFLKKNRSITIGAAGAGAVSGNTTNNSRIIKVTEKNDDKENIDPQNQHSLKRIVEETKGIRIKESKQDIMKKLFDNSRYSNGIVGGGVNANTSDPQAPLKQLYLNKNVSQQSINKISMESRMQAPIGYANSNMNQKEFNSTGPYSLHQKNSSNNNNIIVNYTRNSSNGCHNNNTAITYASISDLSSTSNVSSKTAIDSNLANRNHLQSKYRAIPNKKTSPEFAFITHHTNNNNNNNNRESYDSMNANNNSKISNNVHIAVRRQWDAIQNREAASHSLHTTNTAKESCNYKALAVQRQLLSSFHQPSGSSAFAQQQQQQQQQQNTFAKQFRTIF